MSRSLYTVMRISYTHAKTDERREKRILGRLSLSRIVQHYRVPYSPPNRRALYKLPCRGFAYLGLPFLQPLESMSLISGKNQDEGLKPQRCTSCLHSRVAIASLAWRAWSGSNVEIMSTLERAQALVWAIQGHCSPAFHMFRVPRSYWTAAIHKIRMACPSSSSQVGPAAIRSFSPERRLCALYIVAVTACFPRSLGRVHTFI